MLRYTLALFFPCYSIPTGPELATADVTSASGGEVYIQVSKH